MRVRDATGWLALVLAAGAAAMAMAPLPPAHLDPALDPSFAAVVNYAAAQPAAQRPRLISTYGPLGFSHFSLYLPETFPRLFALRAAFAAVLCWAIAWLGRAAWASPWGGALALAASAPLLRAGDSRLLLLAALALLVELAQRPPPVPLRLALGAMLGLEALVKVTAVSAGVVVLAPLTLAALLARRRPPMIAVAALVTAAVAWAALGLDPAAALAYVDWSLREITPGYSSAMQLRTTAALVYHAAAVSGALLAWATLLAWRRRRPGWWAVPIAFAALLLLQFKAGFVRADVHVFTTVFALLLEGMLLALLSTRRPLAAGAALALWAALPGALLYHALLANGTPTTVFRFMLPRDLMQRLAALPDVADGAVFAARHAQRARELVDLVALPDFAGGVDMFGHAQGLLIANRAPYQPRPVFHGYMAYTPALARENAAYLESAAAPRWILFDPGSIDGRLPAGDDAASWPVLLTRYRAAGTVGQFALLERRATARPWRLVPLGAVDAQTDSPIAVPPVAGGAVWARIDLRETVGDRLRALLFAGPYLSVDVIFTSNAVWRARVAPAIARDGILLSPAISSVPAFVTLMEQGADALRDQEVGAIRIHVDAPLGGSAPAHAVHVDFARLEIGRPPE